MDTTEAVRKLNALAHEERLELFKLLISAGNAGIASGDVARKTEQNLKTTSAQLSVLKNAGMVTTKRNGRSIIYSADYIAIRSLISFLMKDCCQGRRDILQPLRKIFTRQIT